MSGRVVAIVGPSGAGKDTLMHMAAVLRPELHLIRRVITRPEDAVGEEFISVDAEEFEQLRSQGKFVLDWQAHGLSYGIPSQVDYPGISLVNLSRSVLTRAAAVYPDFSAIHISATPDVLQSRLAARGRENAEQIATRVTRGAPFDAGGLSVTNIDNSGSLDRALISFLAAIDRIYAT